MQVEILLFAAVRDAAGSDSIAVEVAGNACAGDILAALADRLPQIAPLLPACRLAVDSTYVASSATIPAGSEVALIPPVSGG
jgi:molybdopterin converting factor subunit 1